MGPNRAERDTAESSPSKRQTAHQTAISAITNNQNEPITTALKKNGLSFGNDRDQYGANK